MLELLKLLELTEPALLDLLELAEHFDLYVSVCSDVDCFIWNTLVWQFYPDISQQEEGNSFRNPCGQKFRNPCGQKRQNTFNACARPTLCFFSLLCVLYIEKYINILKSIYKYPHISARDKDQTLSNTTLKTSPRLSWSKQT